MANVFLKVLQEVDVAAVMKIWPQVFPGAVAPKNREEALMVIHYARTQCEAMDDRRRCWSHAWLLDHNKPSGLPDRLKPKAEKLYPRIVEAVGVSVKSLSASGAPLAKAMEKAMSEAVAEAYADGNTHPDFVKARMDEARDKILRG